MTGRDRAYVWLSMSEGLGPRRVARLLAFCPDVQALMGMRRADWSPHVGGAVASAMEAARDRVDAMADKLEAMGIRVVGRENAEYPADLQAVYDPPVALYVRGTARIDPPKPLAMVGSRRCTRYGREVGHKLAADLAREGVCVVSGLARGVDTACHAGALSGGGATIAVLGCGHDVIYPPENAALYGQIAEKGAIISEYLPGTQPFASNFPLRNRIISGMSKGVVLVEAAAGSGAMITIDYALEHGREIFAVPGNITSSQSLQPNRLIRDGANMAACANDILSAMGWGDLVRSSAKSRASVQLSIEEAAIVAAASDQDMTFEELLAETGIDPPSLNSHLTMLTLRGIMKQSAGRVFSVNREI